MLAMVLEKNSSNVCSHIITSPGIVVVTCDHATCTSIVTVRGMLTQHPSESAYHWLLLKVGGDNE